MGVTIKFGKPGCPWLHRFVPPPKPNHHYVVMVQSNKPQLSARMRTGFWEEGEWSPSFPSSSKVYCWHPEGAPVDVHRAIRTAVWITKMHGPIPENEWFQRFLKAWQLMPWEKTAGPTKKSTEPVSDNVLDVLGIKEQTQVLYAGKQMTEKGVSSLFNSGGKANVGEAIAAHKSMAPVMNKDASAFQLFGKPVMKTLKPMAPDGMVLKDGVIYLSPANWNHVFPDPSKAPQWLMNKIANLVSTGEMHEMYGGVLFDASSGKKLSELKFAGMKVLENKDMPENEVMFTYDLGKEAPPAYWAASNPGEFKASNSHHVVVGADKTMLESIVEALDKEAIKSIGKNKYLVLKTCVVGVNTVNEGDILTVSPKENSPAAKSPPGMLYLSGNWWSVSEVRDMALYCWKNPNMDVFIWDGAPGKTFSRSAVVSQFKKYCATAPKHTVMILSTKHCDPKLDVQGVADRYGQQSGWKKGTSVRNLTAEVGVMGIGPKNWPYPIEVSGEVSDTSDIIWKAFSGTIIDLEAL